MAPFYVHIISRREGREAALEIPVLLVMLKRKLQIQYRGERVSIHLVLWEEGIHTLQRDGLAGERREETGRKM